jgi:hypothetical protein
MALSSSRATLRRQDHPATAELRLGQASHDEHLKRLEASVSWLRREGTIAAIDAEVSAAKRARRLPRVAQLPSILGLPPVGGEPVSAPPSGPRPVLSFEPAPPSASDRLQALPPLSERSFELRAALFILLGSIVAGSIAYHLSTGGSLSAAAPAQAASFDAQ